MRCSAYGGVLELVDKSHSKCDGRKAVWVRSPPPLPGVNGGMVPESGCKPVAHGQCGSIPHHSTKDFAVRQHRGLLR